MCVKYAVTINPNDDFQFFKDCMSERLKKAENHMKYVLKSQPNFQFDLHMEISCKGRIHWHGTLEFKHHDNIRVFYFEFINEFLTKHTMELDTLSETKISKKYESWDEYCTKQIHLVNIHLITLEIMKNKLNIKNVNKIQHTFDDY